MRRHNRTVFGTIVSTCIALLQTPAAEANSKSVGDTLAPSRASGGKSPDQVPSRIAPTFSRNPFWNGTTLGLGVVLDALNATTREDRSDKGSELAFSADEPGLIVSMDQQIRTMFSGGVSIKLGNWKMGESEKSYDEPILILSLLSRAEFFPPLDSLLGSSAGSLLRPFVSIGLGYFRFVKVNSDSFEYQSSLRGEGQLAFGAGTRVVFFNSTAISLAVTSWQGVQSSKFGGKTYSVELQFGDFVRR